MRYGREEGRLSDTATRCCSAVMYNGNTRALAESRTTCADQAHVHTHACTPATNLQTNCTQIDLIGSPSGL